MKKKTIVVAFMFAAIFAFSEPGPISVGILATVAPLDVNYQKVNSSGSMTDIYYTYATIGAQVFLDLVYVEASAAVQTAITPLNATVTQYGTSVSGTTSFAMTQMDLRLVAKYPFHIRRVTLFPLAGVAADFCLGGNLNNMDFSKDGLSNFSPWWLVAGVGGDIRITNGFFIRFEITGAYDMTSKYADSYYNALGSYNNSWGLEIKEATGVGFVL